MKSKKIKKFFNIFNLLLIGVFLLTSGFGCKGVSRQTQQYLEPITLNYWRVWDGEDAFADIINEYRAMHPNIKINYRKFRYEEYEQELLNAFAEDRGPDIFSIHELWLKKYQPKLAPMPSQITMAYQQVKEGIKKEVVTELVTKKTHSDRKIKSDYAETVFKDIVIDGQVYGFPMSLETLVMFYNKDILNRAGIAQPPSNWRTFQEDVQKITRFDSEGNIKVAGTALGTSNNVVRSSDILSVLMMQNGAEMTDANGYATFLNTTKDKYSPGIEAINFYTDFASPVKNVYSWNSDMPNSFDAFYTGQVAFVFGYNYHIPIIKAKAPRLNFGVATIPQISPGEPVNYASYWVETVSKKSEYSNEAWDFILFATNEKRAKKYLDATRKPTALKSLIDVQIEEEDLNAAVSQVLTADSWYTGKDSLAVEKAMDDMITQINGAVEEKEFKDILKVAVQKINQTVK